MKLLLTILLIISFTNFLYSQKASIDSTTYAKWPSLSAPILSNDGQYALFYIYNQPQQSQTLIIKASFTDWEMEVKGGIEGKITEDGHHLIFKNSNDSLGILTLGTSLIEYVSNVISFKTPKNGKGDWLAYALKTSNNELIVKNLITHYEMFLFNTTSYFFNENGTGILIEQSLDSDSSNSHCLKWINFLDQAPLLIWKGDKIYSCIFYPYQNKLAFTSKNRISGKLLNCLWYYKENEEQAELLLNDASKNINYNYAINCSIGYPNFRFANNGKNLVFSLQDLHQSINQQPTGVDIWSYKDPKLQSQQLWDLDPTNIFGTISNHKAMISIADHNLTIIEGKNENVFNVNNNDNDLTLVIRKCGDAENEWNWNKKALTSIYATSLKSGKRQLIKEGVPDITAASYQILPNGKYVIFYDPLKKNYFSQNLNKREVINITKHIHTIWTSLERKDEPKSSYLSIGIAGFIDSGIRVLIYDRYDLFSIDPSGLSTPINITNSYGRKHNIVFRLGEYSNIINLRSNEQVLLSAFNLTNKNDGFYIVHINQSKNPTKLIMQPYVFKGYEDSQNMLTFSPIKAKDSNIYLIRRMSASAFPNYYSTRDFKFFYAVSNIHPESAYNWLSTELITWKALNGELLQGILYKPEDFDPNKKYPIIFYYYEKLSDKLNEFQDPEASSGRINIPTFVSNGYLVFTPDISYQVGMPGRSAFNSVVSAAKYLCKKPWIQSKSLGLQGHSFGGFETNYIITHTNIFKAAISASSMSDFISCYGSVIGDGTSRQRQYEMYRDRIGATLWENPYLYIENSPIFKAENVTTPILLMNNKNDDDVPFAQGIEFFTALRRLGKKTWMLQYDGERHTLFSDKFSKDYTYRVFQFFDHYLKGDPAPKWMLDGIRASRKGNDDGLELVRKKDKNDNWVTPGPGLLTPEEQKKVDALQKRKPIKVTIE